MERLNSYRGEKMTPEQRKKLQQALMGLAPSSPEYKAISAALASAGANNPYEDIQPEDDGPFNFGWPTLDFMMPDPETEAMLAERRGPISPENVNPGTTGYDSSGKRPEPGNTRPADSSLPSPAEAADEGKTETGLDLETSAKLEDQLSGSVTSLDMGSENEPGMGFNPYENFQEQNSIRDQMAMAGGNPDDYKFDDVTLGMRGMVTQNPELYANILFGDSPIQQEMMAPFLASAGALAETGMIGPSYGNDLHSGAASPTMRMAAMEDVVNTMGQPGMQFVDPGAIYGDMFSRSSNSYDGETQSPDDIITQIDTTNEALMQAAPYMTKDTSDYLAARLEQARLEYISMLATGENSMTYPAYLKSIGADTWIQG